MDEFNNIKIVNMTPEEIGEIKLRYFTALANKSSLSIRGNVMKKRSFGNTKNHGFNRTTISKEFIIYLYY